MYRISRELSRPWRSLPYVVLGDDILIGCETVGERYLELIGSLGVEHSPLKSFISDEVAEFAKRVLLVPEKGEVSPFPISAVAAHSRDPSRVAAILRGEERKGYRAIQGIPGAVESLVLATQTGENGRGPGSIQGLRDRFRAEAFRADLCTRFLQGGLASGDFVSAICGPAGRDFGNKEVEFFLRAVLVQGARQSLASAESADSFVALTGAWAARVWDKADLARL